jgi:hypothetical protein
MNFITNLLYLFTAVVSIATIFLVIKLLTNDAKAAKEGIPLNCPSCKMWIPAGATVCGHCARDIVIEPKAVEQDIPCPRCKMWIPAGTKVCRSCA